MSLSSPGIGSGLDVNAIVDQLVALERRPITLLETAKTRLDTQLSSYGLMQSYLGNLQSIAAKLAAFMLLAVTLGLRTAASPFYDAVWLAAQIASWISLVLCILRGAPVIYEAFRWERGNQVRG